ncbi:hypothetical protein SMICM304S_07926 [Streptomyces microflavus]
MMPPCWVMPEAISSRTSPQMPCRLGAAKACSWTALSRSTTVAATIASPATSTLSSMPSTPGTKMPPRSTRPSPGWETSEKSGSVGPGGRRKIRPAGACGGPVGTLVGDLLGLAHLVRLVLGGTTLLATSEHVTVLPGRIRPMRSCSHRG